MFVKNKIVLIFLLVIIPVINLNAKWNNLEKIVKILAESYEILESFNIQATETLFVKC